MSCDAHSSTDAWCGNRPSLRCELEQLVVPESESAFFNHARWVQLHESHAYVCPDEYSLDLLSSLQPIVEIGAGTGYWSRLLQDRGVDIVAIDHVVPKTSWTDVVIADHTALSRYPNRTLLMVRPFNGQSEEVVGSWTGKQMIVVQQGPFPNPYNGADGYLIELMQTHGWKLQDTHALWDALDKAFLLHQYEKDSI